MSFFFIHKNFNFTTEKGVSPPPPTSAKVSYEENQLKVDPNRGAYIFQEKNKKIIPAFLNKQMDPKVFHHGKKMDQVQSGESIQPQIESCALKISKKNL